MSDQAWDYSRVGPVKSHYRATPGPIVLHSTTNSPITPTSPTLPNLAFSSVSSLASSSSYSLASPVTPRTAPNGRGKGKDVATAMELAERMCDTSMTEEPRSPTENPFAFDDEYHKSPSPSLDPHDVEQRPSSHYSSDGSSLETPTSLSDPSQRRSTRSANEPLVRLSHPPKRMQPTARKPTMPVELSSSDDPDTDTLRKVQVVMVDVSSVELKWAPGDAEWLVPVRVHILPQQFIIDYHPATPDDERQWLISSALQLYQPMRHHRLQADSILRLSFPGLQINLDTPLPPTQSGMRRSTFTSKDPSQDPTPPDLDYRLVVSEPWRNTFRLSQHLSTQDVWIPAGVEFDLPNDKVETISPCGAVASATLQRMLMLALRRVVGTTRRVGIDVQRAVARADLRRLSFDPSAVQTKHRGYGIVDVVIPGVDGVRLYYASGGNVLEHANEPGWRVAELELLVTELLGSDIEPGPTLVSLPQLRAGYTRVPFTMER